MKKRFFAIILTVTIFLALAVPALAAQEVDALADEITGLVFARVKADFDATIASGAQVSEPFEYDYTIDYTPSPERDDYGVAFRTACTAAQKALCVYKLEGRNTVMSRNGGTYSVHAEFHFHFYDDITNPKLLALAEATKAASDTARGRLEYLNNWLCDNVAYDYADTANGSLDHLFDDGLAVCEGYARAVSAVCLMTGIPCVQLTSTGHKWNLVYVDGAWKMLDVTWNDSAGRRTAYFLVDSIDDEDHVAIDELGAAEYAKKYALTLAGVPAPQPEPEPPAAITAYESAQEVELDGKKITLPAYALKDENGYDTNYVRVRDLAELLDGTAAQFNVDWSGSVDLPPRTPYTTKNGTELDVPFSGPQPYTVYTGETKVGGAVTAFDAFTIVYKDGGHTYYKLRDLGKALGFNVGWSAERGIYIETDREYIG